MGSILNWLCNIVHYSFVVALVWSACVFFLKALLFWGWINPARQNQQCRIRSSFVKTKWQIHVGVMCYLENEHVTVLTVLCKWTTPLGALTCTPVIVFSRLADFLFWIAVRWIQQDCSMHHDQFWSVLNISLKELYSWSMSILWVFNSYFGIFFFWNTSWRLKQIQNSVDLHVLKPDHSTCQVLWLSIVADQRGCQCFVKLFLSGFLLDCWRLNEIQPSLEVTKQGVYKHTL